VGGCRTYNGYLLAVEPDQVTKVTLAYRCGSQSTYLKDNVLGACVGVGSSWLEQTGPTIARAIKSSLGGGSLGGRVTRYHRAKCSRLH
jgi:hypothetical protein